MMQLTLRAGKITGMATPAYRPAQRRRRGRRSSYDPASGALWSPTARIEAHDAARLLGVMKEIHPELPADKVLGVIAGLIPAKPDDEPLTWQRLEAALRALAERFATGQEELPLKTG